MSADSQSRQPRITLVAASLALLGSLVVCILATIAAWCTMAVSPTTLAISDIVTRFIMPSLVGLCYLDEHRNFSCSPDGLVGEDGGLEIKCPLIHTHVEYLLDGKLPTKYVQQVQGSMLISGRKWWDFMSYYPGLKPLVVRVERDEKFIAKLKDELNKFCFELKAIVQKLKEL